MNQTTEKGIQLNKVIIHGNDLNREQETLFRMAETYFYEASKHEAILFAPYLFIRRISMNFEEIDTGTIVVTPYGELLVRVSDDFFGIKKVED